ncbi:hypothetical protein [Azohydromonas aeria]|uniref:hypothetical protein n=1 Tax=Azohydromonas aeria TaxID=2590212 RepID=UPI0012F8505F|nr:hypothetical protein [Azohydromonas aeria]
MSIGGLGISARSGMQRLQPPLREELLRQASERQREGTAAGELQRMRPSSPSAVADTGTNLPGYRLTDADGNEDNDATELRAGIQASLQQLESTLAFARQRAGAAVDAAENRDAVAAARATAAGRPGATDAAAIERDAAGMAGTAGAGAGTAVRNDADQAAAGRVVRNFPWLPNAASNAGPSGGPPGAGTGTPFVSASASAPAPRTEPAPADAAPAPATTDTEADAVATPAPSLAQDAGATARDDALQGLATADADADGDQRLDAAEAATPRGALGKALNPALTAAAPAAPGTAAADAASASPSSALPLREGGLDAQAERLAAWMVQQYAAAGGQAVPGVGQQVNTSA